MPYADPAKQRTYQREWTADRRARYLVGKCCVDCGSTVRLEFDHVNGEKASHRIWTWAPTRLEAELAKCVTRCRTCHQRRHAALRPKHGAGGYKRGCRCGVCRGWKAGAVARERAGRDLHPGTRLCRPLRNSSATSPGEQLSLLESA